MMSGTVYFKACFLTVTVLQLITGVDLALVYNLQRIDELDTTGQFFKSEYTVTKVENAINKYAINGTVDQLSIIDNTFKIAVTAYRSDKDDGKYIKYVGVPAMNACTFIKFFYKEDMYNMLKGVSNLPANGVCPLNPKSYWIKNFVIDASSFDSYVKEGYFKIEMLFTKAGQTKAGIRLFGSVLNG